MRRPFVPFNGSGTSRHKRSSVDFITATFGFRFSVHTGVVSATIAGGSSAGFTFGDPNEARNRPVLEKSV